jgi:hypothetical protein
MLVLLATLMLGACAQTHELAMPKGPLFSLNTGHWTPVPDDLAPPRSTKP